MMRLSRCNERPGAARFNYLKKIQHLLSKAPIPKFLRKRMLYFIADFGQLGHPPGKSSHFAGLSTLREPFGKNHTSSGSCFLYSKPVENRSKKKGSQQALFWGKQEHPTPRRFSGREVMPKKRTFHWRKAITHYTRAGHLLFLKLSSQRAFVRWAFLF